MSRVYQMLELVQRRCSLRFGVGACEATGVACHQSWPTCKFKSAFDRDATIRWRFVPTGQTLRIPVDYADENDLTLHPVACVTSISSIPTRLNIGAIRRGESPFGTRASLTVQFEEFVAEADDGDFYADTRGDLPRAGFFQKLIARVGDAIGQMEAYHYVWREGQDISEAVVSRFDVRNLVANKQGVTLQADDPLQRIDFQKAQFPRATGAILQTSIDAVQVTGINIAFIGAEIGTDYGNTENRRYLRIEKEVIEYTGWTESGGIYTLTGVRRGATGEVKAHAAGEAVQRVGRYERRRMYRIARDLMENHSTLDPSLIDAAQWDSEGVTFLGTLQSSAWITDPVSVNQLVGELCRDGLFQIWWDARAQKVRLQAVRAALAEEISPISQKANIIASQFDRKPDDRLTRVIARYNPRDPFSTAVENYRVVQLRIDVDAEGPFQADGTVRERVINSRWINTEANARQVSNALLLRYSVTPIYATLTLAAKDDFLEVGGTIELETPAYADADGVPIVQRWNIVSFDQDWRAGMVTIECQQSPYTGRFGRWMANDAPAYADATDEQKASGAWWAGNDGTIAGDPPFQYW
jgi:hypothetical protein